MATTHLPPLVVSQDETNAEPRPRRRGRDWFFVGLAALALLVAVTVALVTQTRAPAVPQPMSLLVATAEPAQATGAIEATGVLVPMTETAVVAPQTGTVRRVLVDVGARVRRGQVLARLEALPARAAVTVAEAALVGAEATAFEAEGVLRDLVRAIPPGLDLNQIEPETQLEIEAAFQTAQVRLARALADVEAREAELAVARHQARRTVIRSPVDGEVAERLTHPGAVLQAGAPLFRVTSPSTTLHARVEVDETALPRIQLGAPARVLVPALPGRESPGEVVGIGPLHRTEAESTAHAAVTVALDNSRGDLVAGMGSSAFIDLGDAHTGVRIPAAALRFSPADLPDSEGPGVWVVGEKAGELHRAPVEITARTGDHAEVFSTQLGVGTKVVVGQAAVYPARR